MKKIDLTSLDQTARNAGVLGLRVTQHGEDRGVYHWEDECRRNIYSASKSFTALAVGIAAREGLLSLNEKLTDAFRDVLEAEPGAYLAQATVRDLLTMCLGQEKPILMGAERPLLQEDDWVRLALRTPWKHAPGSVFMYSNAGPYLAGVLVERRCGCDLVSYLRPRLFEPMGIRNPTWEHDPLGHIFGAGGLFLTLSELHRLGVLCLQKGRWADRQLVPESWIEACTGKQVDNGGDGYGYLFWRGKHDSYRADGKYGQWSVVFPAVDAVVTVTAWNRNGEALQALVMDGIYPQLENN